MSAAKTRRRGRGVVGFQGAERGWKGGEAAVTIGDISMRWNAGVYCVLFPTYNAASLPSHYYQDRSRPVDFSRGAGSSERCNRPPSAFMLLHTAC